MQNTARLPFSVCGSEGFPCIPYAVYCLRFSSVYCLPFRNQIPPEKTL